MRDVGEIADGSCDQIKGAGHAAYYKIKAPALEPRPLAGKPAGQLADSQVRAITEEMEFVSTNRCCYGCCGRCDASHRYDDSHRCGASRHRVHSRRCI